MLHNFAFREEEEELSHHLYVEESQSSFEVLCYLFIISVLFFSKVTDYFTKKVIFFHCSGKTIKERNIFRSTMINNDSVF